MLRPDFPLQREMCARLLAEPDTTATTMHLILLTEFGEDLYGDEDDPPMDPVLIWRLAREKFSVTIPEENENKINALMMAVSTDAFYEDPLTFISVSMALYSGDLGDLVSGVMEDPTMNEVLWGIFEVGLNRDDDMEFANGVYQILVKESQDAVEEDEGVQFQFFERELIKGKTKILNELRMIEAPDSVIAQVKNFDETPVHDDAGNILGPNGETLFPWGSA